MKARRHSDCMVCSERIQPGDEIRHEDGMGWIHEACQSRLDWHCEQSAIHVAIHGPNVQTYRQLAASNTQLDAMEDPYDDPWYDDMYDYCD